MGVLGCNGCYGGTKRAGPGAAIRERPGRFGRARRGCAAPAGAGWVKEERVRQREGQIRSWPQRVGGAKCLALLKATKGAALVLAEAAEGLARAVREEGTWGKGMRDAVGEKRDRAG